MATNPNTRTAAARAFVRSLNILLKFARMYDFGHPRTAKQYETAWSELRTALGSDNDAGVLLAVSGDQLLLDGTPLESAAAEKSFARMLSSSGIASIHFSPKVTQASLARFVRGFPTSSGSKPGQLAEQLKAALQGDPHIHVNEVCFVPADSAVARTTVAAQLAARTLGMNSEQTDELLNDPEKLLQLIVAAEGTKGGPGGGGPGGGGGGGNGPGGGGGGNGSGRRRTRRRLWWRLRLRRKWRQVRLWRGERSCSRGGGTGSGSGSGSSDGTASGTRAGRFSGSASAVVTGNSGAGTEVSAGSGEGGNGTAISGATAPGQGSGSGGAGSGGPAGNPGTWNIVGGSETGSGGGAPLDPNAGGFWFNKGDAPSTPGGSTVGAPDAGSQGASLSSSISGWERIPEDRLAGRGQLDLAPVDPEVAVAADQVAVRVARAAVQIHRIGMGQRERILESAEQAALGDGQTRQREFAAAVRRAAARVRWPWKPA